MVGSFLTFGAMELKNINWLMLRARSHLATVTQLIDVVSMSSEMGCIVTNVTVCT